MIDKLPAESSIYGDSAYLDYGLEENALKRKAILVKIQRMHKPNAIDPFHRLKIDHHFHWFTNN